MSTASSSTHRAAGTSPTASPLACIMLHSAPPTPSHPPGQRPLTLHTATVPPNAAPPPPPAPAPTLIGTASCEPSSSSSTCTAIARGVGYSNTTVDDSTSPDASHSWFASSVAASESMPASISGVLATITSSDPPTACTTFSTSASTCGCRFDGSSAMRAAASGFELCSGAAPSAVLAGRTSSKNVSLAGTLRMNCSASQCIRANTGSVPPIAAQRHAAYSSRVKLSSFDICSVLNVAAPIPIPPISGNCRLRAAAPHSCRHRARLSMYVLAELYDICPMVPWHAVTDE
eukprot:scaffold72144_cov64-Phaeocystis_antarctica.AAC.3